MFRVALAWAYSSIKEHSELVRSSRVCGMRTCSGVGLREKEQEQLRGGGAGGEDSRWPFPRVRGVRKEQVHYVILPADICLRLKDIHQTAA